MTLSDATRRRLGQLIPRLASDLDAVSSPVPSDARWPQPCIDSARARRHFFAAYTAERHGFTTEPADDRRRGLRGRRGRRQDHRACRNPAGAHHRLGVLRR